MQFVRFFVMFAKSSHTFRPLFNKVIIENKNAHQKIIIENMYEYKVMHAYTHGQNNK